MTPNHIIDLVLRPSDHRAELAYQLWLELRPYDWSVVWTYWSPGVVSYLHLEGPTHPQALRIIEQWVSDTQLALQEEAV